MRIQMMMSQALRITFLSFNVSMLTGKHFRHSSYLLKYIHTTKNDDVNIFSLHFIKTILLAAEHSIPKIKSKKISKHTGNAWWSKDCKQAVYLKKGAFKKWLKNITDKNFVSMKRAKIQCKFNKRKLKRHIGLNFVRMKYQNQKSGIKYGKS